MRSSRSNFLPDDKMKLRAIGSAAVTTVAYSQAIELGRLAAYWHTNEIGGVEELIARLNVTALSTGNSRSYTVSVEVDATDSFPSPTTVETVTLGSANLTAAGVYELAISADAIKAIDTAGKFIRLKVTANSVFETGSIAFSSVANAGDTVTISDGTGTAVFTFAASGNSATGAAVNVAVGASATDSAQNLKAAIDANLTINVGTAGAAATLTLTNDNAPTGGSIAKSDADNDYTVTDFSGGYQASITFWAYFVAPKAMAG